MLPDILPARGNRILMVLGGVTLRMEIVGNTVGHVTDVLRENGKPRADESAWSRRTPPASHERSARVICRRTTPLRIMYIMLTVLFNLLRKVRRRVQPLRRIGLVRLSALATRPGLSVHFHLIKMQVIPILQLQAHKPGHCTF